MDAVTKDPFNYLESSLKFTCFTSDFELKCALSLNVILVIGFAFFFRNNVRVTLNGPVDVTGGSRDGPSANDVASITISGRMKRRIGGEK